MVVHRESETETGELVSEQAVRCKYCDKFFVSEDSCHRHEMRCGESERVVGNRWTEANDVGVVDAETYYTVSARPDAYHIDSDCPMAEKSVPDVDGRSKANTSARGQRKGGLRERSKHYVEWHELQACPHCVMDE